jgi:ATP-dependent DNA ligase
MPAPITRTLPRIEPIVPKSRPQPFNDPDWLFEPKYDGFRGMLYLTRQTCIIYSKRQNALARFDDLRKRICAALPRRELILDGEIIAVKDGKMDFMGLMRGQGHIVYAVFDVL